MPRARNDDAAVLLHGPAIQGRCVQLDDYSASFKTFPPNAVLSPNLAAGGAR